MPSQEEIDEQQKLLAAHRRTLAHLLSQQAQFSAGFIPAHVANGIQEARESIAVIKTALRGWGAEFEDLPNDTARDKIALSAEQNDANLLKEHRVIFQRRAFSAPCLHELSLSELMHAIDDTIAAINTGCLKSRRGDTLKTFPDVGSYRTQQYKGAFENILEDLFRLQEATIGLKPIFYQYSSTSDPEYFEFLIDNILVSKNIEVAIDLVRRMDEIDGTRNKVVSQVNQLLQISDEYPLPLMELSSDIIKRVDKHNPFRYREIANLT